MLSIQVGVADHAGTKKFLTGSKYDDALVNEISPAKPPPEEGKSRLTSRLAP